jgi:hypothetical protein
VQKSLRQFEEQLGHPGAEDGTALLGLRIQEHQLIQKFGPNHPRVVDVREHIQVLQQTSLLNAAQDHELIAMRLQEKRLLRQYGADHPAVRSVRDRIGVWQLLKRWRDNPELVERKVMRELVFDDDVDLAKDRALLQEFLESWSSDQELKELHLLEMELSQTFGSDHPRLKSIRKRIGMHMDKLRREPSNEPIKPIPKPTHLETERPSRIAADRR